jgi:hypothetical protein
MESFMEAGQGQNWCCSDKGKKIKVASVQNVPLPYKILNILH